jgi:biotin synthase
LADGVLNGRAIDRAAALRIMAAPEAEIPALLRAALRIREHFHGRRVKLCLLRNARSGLCPEDCHYCSQSSVSEADIPRYRLDSVDTLLDGARRAVAAGARRFCMVTSGRGPSANDIDRFGAAARRIKADYPDLELCVSAGIMEEEQARSLKAAGVGWVNHNLNGIIGMGENDDDVIDLAFALRDLEVDSLPVNFLIPIPGTPLAACRELTPARCLKALTLFRFCNPTAEIRMAGGREGNLGWFQPLALLAANSLFVDGYLTTPGQAAAETQQMVTAMGFDIESA